MNLIEIIEVSKRYRDHTALQQVSFGIPKGSSFGLLGPNGAGKTSLIRILTRITMPDSGSILFEGQALQAQHVRSIGYLPEERGLYKKMKVGDQLLYLAQLKGLSLPQARQRLKLWMEKLDLMAWWDKKVEDLSKGMQQKVQFISTVVHQPSLIILDEPFSGFDPVNVAIIKQEIKDLQQAGATIIFSTHRMENVEELCSHIALINKSKVVLQGSLEEVRAAHSQPYAFLVLAGPPQPGLLPGAQLQQQDHTSHTLKINLEDKSLNQVLQQVLPQATVLQASLATASINDIFLQTVKESNA